MKLIRPYISAGIRCRVALRQLAAPLPDNLINTRRCAAGGLGRYLSELLGLLAESLGCDVAELRLDHLPALAIRDKVFRNGVHVDYDPPCDSADDLIYRTHVAHLVKTNHSGDHGQHPDRVLIKKERRRERGPKPKRGPRMQGRGFASSTDKLKPKMTWPSRPFPKKRKER